MPPASETTFVETEPFEDRGPGSDCECRDDSKRRARRRRAAASRPRGSGSSVSGIERAVGQRCRFVFPGLADVEQIDGLLGGKGVGELLDVDLLHHDGSNRFAFPIAQPIDRLALLAKLALEVRQIIEVVCRRSRFRRRHGTQLRQHTHQLRHHFGILLHVRRRRQSAAGP